MGLLQNATLEIMLARQPEKPFAVRFNMVTVEQPLATVRHDRAASVGTAAGALHTVYSRLAVQHHSGFC
jgi:hypothetical protein